MAKILIVEDNPDSREIIRTILEKEGFVVFDVDSGEKALEVIDESFSFVLLDMSLPGVSGWDVAKKIKEKNPSLAVVAVTAHAMKGDREKAIEAGCDDYLSKPVHPSQILEKIKKLTSR